ncbi:ABC transporter permease [Synechococcus sp. PCC 7336]|uniref:ABC transporter permease n=1 Tax=Synechococcus sp. PCC 7336 TaxID=195250 RepID=UPI00034ACC80|nr:ABC transporter permease [Synechococcus sp. PCC 7336]
MNKNWTLLSRLPAHWLLATPALVLLLFFFWVPIILLVRVSFYAGGGNSGFGIGGGGFYEPGTWTLEAYQFLFQDSYFYEVLTFTVALGISLTLLILLLAYPLSLVIHRLPLWLKSIALAAVILPKLANPLIVIYGIQLLLSHSGPINQALVGLGIVSAPLMLFHNFTGVVIGGVYAIVPYAVLILVTALDRIDANLLPAARGLGASSWQAFWRVTFPLSLPGLTLAAMLSSIFALGLLEAPSLLGSPQEITLAVDIRKQTFENLNWPRGAAEAAIVLVAVGICMTMYALSSRWAIRRRS